MKLIHITDTHIHKAASDNRTVSARLRAVAKYMDKVKEETLLVHSGDVTDDGSEEQYKQARKLLSPFQGRILLVPGQHDFGFIGNFYDEECVDRFRSLRAFLQTRSPARRSLHLNFLLLDSCLHTPEILDLAMGEVAKRDLSKIREYPFTLNPVNNSGKVVVVLHHTPLAEPWYLRLRNAKEFLNACLGRVDVVLCGHDHGKRVYEYPGGDNKKPVRTIVQQAPALYLSKSQPMILDIIEGPK